jgi:nicotinamide phosphoribosyltransferase
MRQLRYNPILNTDSYKCSHYLQYPPGTEYVYSYIEARGGEYDYTVFFGLQYFLREYLSTPIEQWMIDEADEIITEHGEPFNREGWEYILREHAGKLPLQIFAAEEGSVIPVSNALVGIVNTDKKCAWLTSYIEPSLLRAVWYGTTVATLSRSIKELIQQYYDKSVDETETVDFALHDFGARGVSSAESCMIGAAAHLVNFRGTDSLDTIRFIKHYYDHKIMPAHSVPASEHSSITSWGRDREVDAYRNMIDVFGGVGKIVSVVSDSYDIEHACAVHWGDTLKDLVIDTGTKLVIRPDSGDPVEINRKLLRILASKFGYTINSKGYKVLNHVKLLQGDGINKTSIDAILTMCLEEGFAANVFVFGMGGALLGGPQRDTQKWAMKCSAICINGVWQDVFKDPITDTGKRSKKGIVWLFTEKNTGAYKTIDTLTQLPDTNLSCAMNIVFNNGDLSNEVNYEQVRQRAAVPKGVKG